MELSVQFHNIVDDLNFLEKPTATIKDFLHDNPTVYKIALLINHIFRAVSMCFFMLMLPYSYPVNLAICFSASLFYRLTVEGNCTYKFALPAFGGAVAIPFARTALANIISKAAFHSFTTLTTAIGTLLPITAYLTYIALTVNYDVDKNCDLLTFKPRCCRK